MHGRPRPSKALCRDVVLTIALIVASAGCDSRSARAPTGASRSNPTTGEVAGNGKVRAQAVAPPLGPAGSFAVLASSTVTNTGPTVVNGDLGVSPGSALTGFPPGIVNGTIHLADGTSLAAQSAITTAYNALAGQACNIDLTGQDLGGMTLTPGAYCFSSSAQLTGTLTLDGLGNPGSVWVFQIGSTLTTAAGSSVSVINNVVVQPCIVFWQVGSSATLGAGNQFQGHILALASITVGAGTAIVSGSTLARTGAVTLDTDAITGCSQSVVPTRPSTWSAVKTYYR